MINPEQFRKLDERLYRLNKTDRLRFLAKIMGEQRELGENRMVYAQFMRHQETCSKCDWPLFRCADGESIRLVTTHGVPDDVGKLVGKS